MAQPARSDFRCGVGLRQRGRKNFETRRSEHSPRRKRNALESAWFASRRYERESAIRSVGIGFWTLLLILALGLPLVGCGGPKLNNDALYGVWLGQDSAKERVMLTFILGGKCDVEYPDRKPKTSLTGKWALSEGHVVVELNDKTRWTFALSEEEFEGEPALYLSGSNAPKVKKN